jgi:ketosteroid isomerase-like protein
MKTTKITATLLMAWMAMSANACFARKPPNIVMNEKIIREYYSAYEKKDWHMLELILADGFTFTSPAGDDHISLKQYKEKCWPNASNTRKFDLEKVIIAGDDAFVTYNGWTNDGRLFRNTERFKLREGKIIENECFFGAGVNFPNNRAKMSTEP